MIHTIQINIYSKIAMITSHPGGTHISILFSNKIGARGRIIGDVFENSKDKANFHVCSFERIICFT